MKNYLKTLITILFITNIATTTIASNNLIFQNGFEGSGFELPFVVAAGNTINDVSKDITVNLSSTTVRHIYLWVHNLQMLPNDAAMASFQVINSLGQSSTPVKLNNTDGVDSGIVRIRDNAKAYGGIGEGFHTLLLRIDVNKLKRSGANIPMTLTNKNIFRFYLHNEAYAEGASAYRIIGLNVYNSSYDSLLSGAARRNGPGYASDAANYIASNNSDNITEGLDLWENKTLLAKPGDSSIRAKCMDCHTSTGYDLKYFGYSNESIYKRSRFHGFNDVEAKKLTRYIRNLPTPTYGRPWNPPYQPGEVKVAGVLQPLSSRPIERWAAGAGSVGVLVKDQDMLEYVFPDTNSNGQVDQVDVDDAFRLSQINPGASYLGINLIDIPIHLQLPDWNRWLPRVHPLDIWPDFMNVNQPDPDNLRPDPYTAYINLADIIENGEIPSKWRISRIMADSANFSAEGATGYYVVTLGQEGRIVVHTPHRDLFRSASLDNTGRLNIDSLRAGSSAPYSDDMHEEYAKRALTHWMGVKYFEVHHVGGLEDKLQETLGDPNLANARGWGSTRGAVFHHAPHKTASNARYWEGRTRTYDPDNPQHMDADDQSLVMGDYLSTVWYHLEAILNPGHKQQISGNLPVDWAYNFSYFNRLDIRSGESQAMIYVATMMKNYQVRDMTAEDPIGGTFHGLALRTLAPFMVYATNQTGGQVRSDILLKLNEYSPSLYRYFLNTTLKRWMQTVKHPIFPYRYSTNNALNELDDWPRDDNMTYSTWTDQWSTYEWSVLPPKTYKPTGGDGRPRLFNSANSADNCWRLLPRLIQDGVNSALVADYKNWCKAAWPGPASNPNDWDSRL